MRRLISWALVLVLLALWFSFAGAWHPAADSVAVMRLPLGVLGAVLCAGLWALGQGRRALAGVLGLGLALAPPAWSFLPLGGAGPGPVTLYQKNLRFSPADRSAFLSDVAAAAPDLLTLQEVSSVNRPLLARLAPVLPYQYFCSFAAVGGVAVASRWPLIEGSQVCAEGLAAVRVARPEGPLWVVSLHLHWPWPHGQGEQLAQILPVLQGLDGPTVLGGDFNMVPWGYSVRRIAAATGGVRAGPAHGTFPLPGRVLRLPIDHVLAPGGGQARTRPLLGSDHLGLLARLWP